MTMGAAVLYCESVHRVSTDWSPVGLPGLIARSPMLGSSPASARHFYGPLGRQFLINPTSRSWGPPLHE